MQGGLGRGHHSVPPRPTPRAWLEGHAAGQGLKWPRPTQQPTLRARISRGGIRVATSTYRPGQLAQNRPPKLSTLPINKLQQHRWSSGHPRQLPRRSGSIRWTETFYKLVVLASGIAGGFKRQRASLHALFSLECRKSSPTSTRGTANDAQRRLMGGTILPHP